MAKEEHLSPALRTSLELLLVVVAILAERFGLNSKNSSTPPAADPNRIKKPKEKSSRPTGGQIGHKGKTLQPVDDPDHVENRFLAVSSG
jgi:transposase